MRFWPEIGKTNLISLSVQLKVRIQLAARVRLRLSKYTDPELAPDER